MTKINSLVSAAAGVDISEVVKYVISLTGFVASSPQPINRELKNTNKNILLRIVASIDSELVVIVLNACGSKLL